MRVLATRWARRATRVGLLVSALTLVGCPFGSRGGLSDGEGPPQFSKADAIILAKLEAKAQGIRIEPYEVAAKLNRGVWCVSFVKPAPKRSKGWPDEFVVEVWPAGRVRLVKES